MVRFQLGFMINIVIFVNIQIADDLRRRLEEQIDLQLKRLYEGLDSGDQSDYSIYTGTTAAASREGRQGRQSLGAPE